MIGKTDCDYPHEVRNVTWLKDIESFCKNRMEATDGKMSAAYRDVLFLVRQHLKVAQQTTSYKNETLEA